MRVWDISTEKFCKNHLLGEHRELHAIWNICTQNKKGYSNHPETIRWKGKLKALYLRHEKQVIEMEKRGYIHKSPLNKNLTTGTNIQNELVNTIDKQKNILKQKNCDYNI